jgi:hypothetical protein
MSSVTGSPKLYYFGVKNYYYIDIISFFRKAKEFGLTSIDFDPVSNVLFTLSNYFIDNHFSTGEAKPDKPSMVLIKTALSTKFGFYITINIDTFLSFLTTNKTKFPFYNPTYRDELRFPLRDLIENYEIIVKNFDKSIMARTFDYFIINSVQKFNSNLIESVDTSFKISTIQKFFTRIHKDESFKIAFSKVYDMLDAAEYLDIFYVFDYLRRRNGEDFNYILNSTLNYLDHNNIKSINKDFFNFILSAKIFIFSKGDLGNYIYITKPNFSNNLENAGVAGTHLVSPNLRNLTRRNNRPASAVPNTVHPAAGTGLVLPSHRNTPTNITGRRPLPPGPPPLNALRRRPLPSSIQTTDITGRRPLPPGPPPANAYRLPLPPLVPVRAPVRAAATTGPVRRTVRISNRRPVLTNENSNENSNNETLPAFTGPMRGNQSRITPRPPSYWKPGYGVTKTLNKSRKQKSNRISRKNKF